MKTFLVLCCLVAASTQNLVTNGDVEGPEFGSGVDKGWYCPSCLVKGAVMDDVYAGNFSYLGHSRKTTWAGPRLNMSPLIEGKMYRASIMVKLLPPTDGSPTAIQTVKFTMEIRKLDGSRTFERIAEVDTFVESGWFKMEREFVFGPGVAYQDLKEVQIFVEGPEIQYGLLVDNAYLAETSLPSNANWRTQALADIETHRKDNFTLRLRTWAGHSGLYDYTLEIAQVFSSFGLGAAVDGFYFQHHEPYRNWMYNHFDWATLSKDMTWRETELSRDTPTFELADEVIQNLKWHDKRVRGHTIFQSDVTLEPDWVEAIQRPSDLYRAVMKRIDDSVGRYKYKVYHWNVNNMMFDNHFYSNRYLSSKIVDDMFKEANRADPSAELFLNEDGALTGMGIKGSSMVHTANLMRNKGLPVGGLGAIAHFGTEKPSGPLLSECLKRLDEAGLPVWISEYSYQDINVNARATALEDTFLAAFSNPNVDGFVLWGYWDQEMSLADAALVEGDEATPNAAGLKWEELFATYGRSVHTMPLNIGPGANDYYDFRLLHGDYKIRTRDSTGKVTREWDLSIVKGKGDMTQTLWL